MIFYRIQLVFSKLNEVDQYLHIFLLYDVITYLPIQ
jgi:hypothetical protein